MARSYMRPEHLRQTSTASPASPTTVRVGYYPSLAVEALALGLCPFGS
jgi:hypothetical protein